MLMACHYDPQKTLSAQSSRVNATTVVIGSKSVKEKGKVIA
jgi:hypothetical protein